MKYWLGLFLLLASPAYAAVDAWNDDSDLNNRVYVKVTNEPLSGAFYSYAAVVAIPPRSPGQFHIISLCPGPSFRVTPEGWPIAPECRPISAWGTEPRKSDLMRQVQTDRHVQFRADFDFDADYGVNVDGAKVTGWRKRGNSGGWPRNYTAAIYVRGQAGKKVGGNGQINFAARCQEGTDNTPDMEMRAQTRGFSSAGNTDAVDDHQRVVISRGDGQLCVRINPESYGLYLNSGFDLMF